MKAIIRLAASLCLIATSALAEVAAETPAWEGAWSAADGPAERALLVVDGYLAHAAYDREKPEFHRTFGGPFEADGARATLTIHFDSAEPERVGGTLTFSIEREGDALRLRFEDGAEEAWQRVAESASPLAGAWRITGREVGGAMTEMPLRARRTLKVLTGSRFQWIAMNIETGEFSGTGGGRYTFEDGTYAEIIEFFSRDSSRVGARLEFQGEVEDGAWRHRGLSSRGEPIHEVWSKIGAEE